MSHPPPHKIAFLCHPLPYGLYTVFRHLRTGLAQLGYDLRWVGTEPEAANALHDPQWASHLSYGHVIPAVGRSDAQRARDLYDHLLNEQYTTLIVNPPQAFLQLNIVRYLPPAIRRILIHHSMSPGSYVQAAAIRSYVHAGVGVSPRVQQDLIQRRIFPPELAFAIPNAIDLAPYQTLARVPSNTFRIVYLGRIDAPAKGVLNLPRFMAKVRASDARLTIVGDGPDMQQLQKLAAPFADRIEFAGVVHPNDVPATLQRFDALILPSPREGLGYSLIEGMAAGCIPLATRIRGVTDFVVREGVTGQLFSYGDATAAAAIIDSLAADPARRARLSAAARRDAFDRFGVGPFARSYAEVLQTVGRNPREIAPPLPIEHWQYPPEMSGSIFRRMLPAGAKNFLRRFLRPG
jgi:glycosyltransferase involved in cell wall biosynthesis